ncbi:MAG: cation diffusion facilitator family transporter [Thermoproteota archaeon]|nr:cation diffusion facilitator family transporter [Thermoproteota archaeon]
MNRAFSESKRITWFSIWILLSIGISEIAISAFTGTITLFADGIDSLADALVSFTVWFGIYVFDKPKSKLFHFGYAKVESYTAFISAIIIVILGVFSAYRVYDKIALSSSAPADIANPEINMAVLVVSGTICLHRALIMKKVAKKHNLVSLNLAYKNIFKDAYGSFAGFGALFAGYYFAIPYMDSAASITLTVLTFYMAYIVIKESSLVLLDAIKNPKLQDEIKNYIEGKFHISVEDVLIRPIGHTFSSQIYIVVDPSLTLDKVYEIMINIQKSIISEFNVHHTVVIPKPKTNE